VSEVTPDLAGQLALVKRNSQRAREATRVRDLTIATARDAGLSLRVIAQAAGLSHTAVAKIAGSGPLHGRSARPADRAPASPASS
jgi:hypothetical protein